MIVFFHIVVKTQYLVQYHDPVEYQHKRTIQSNTCDNRWCQRWLGTVRKDNHFSFCRWCTYLASLYKKCGYILGVLRPQQFPEEMIETVNSQNYIINLGFTFFLFSLVSNLAYIYYSLCQIWSVYMQYSRCCDHSNKCLFLVIQQTEVLLNYFWWVYVTMKLKFHNSFQAIDPSFHTRHMDDKRSQLIMA